MTLESFLLLLVAALAVGALVVAWVRPDGAQQQYQTNLSQLGDAYAERLKNYQTVSDARYNTLDNKLQNTNTQLEAVRVEYRELAEKYLRLVGENIWLRAQLRAQNIAIPSLPDDLKPYQDADGKIVISVRQGGVDVNDQSTITTQRDLVGGGISGGEKQP